MRCAQSGCEKDAEHGRPDCFRHRVLGVGFRFQGGAIKGRAGFHTTKNDWLREHLNVDSEKQLLKRPDVERA